METDFATKLRWMKDYLLAPSRGSVVVTCVSCDQEMQELTRVSVLPLSTGLCGIFQHARSAYSTYVLCLVVDLVVLVIKLEVLKYTWCQMS